MLHLRIIARALSGLILLEAVLMGLCYALSFYYGESAHRTWLIPIGACLVASLVLSLLSRKANPEFGVATATLSSSRLGSFIAYSACSPSSPVA